MEMGAEQGLEQPSKAQKKQVAALQYRQACQLHHHHHTCWREVLPHDTPAAGGAKRGEVKAHRQSEERRVEAGQASFLSTGSDHSCGGWGGQEHSSACLTAWIR